MCFMLCYLHVLILWFVLFNFEHGFGTLHFTTVGHDGGERITGKKMWLNQMLAAAAICVMCCNQMRTSFIILKFFIIAYIQYLKHQPSNIWDQQRSSRRSEHLEVAYQLDSYFFFFLLCINGICFPAYTYLGLFGKRCNHQVFLTDDLLGHSWKEEGDEGRRRWWKHGSYHHLTWLMLICKRKTTSHSHDKKVMKILSVTLNKTVF